MTIFTQLVPLMSLILLCCGCRQNNGASGATAEAVAESESDMAPEVSVAFDADSAYANVEAQVNCGPRVPGSAGHAMCRDLIIDKLRHTDPDTLILQNIDAENFKGDPMPLTNIMARYGVDRPRRILLAAHWDTRPWADNDPNERNHDKPVPGANDGASGAGVLLEIARHLALQHPAIGVDLLFVDGEDSGGDEGGEDSWCVGTQYWTRSMPYDAGRRPMYGVLLDMVGGREARFRREYVSDRFAPAILTRVWQRAARSGYSDRFINENGGAVVDDHLVINRAGIPCIDIIECTNPSTGSFPPYWHTVADDMSNIDTATLKAVGQTLTDLIYSEK